MPVFCRWNEFAALHDKMNLCWLLEVLMSKLNLAIIFVILTGLLINPAMARDDGLKWVNISERWADIRYNFPSDQQIEALKTLGEDIQTQVTSEPRQAEPLVLYAVVLSTLSRLQGGSAGLGLAKQAKQALDQAEQIQPEVLDGLVYTLKGSLYFKVPGWPIGFGDPVLAKTYLERALTINPHNIDANYFYGEFLLQNREFERAIAAFEQVLAAEPRPGQTLADSGRKQEARAAIVRADALMQAQQTEINRILH
jgi:tetratricopeptide (TPR) repeat protein